MITALLRRDPAMGFNALVFRFVFPLSIAAMTMWTTISSSFAGARDRQDSVLSTTFALCIALLWLTTFSPLVQGRTRVFEYQLSLPISARKLVGLRLAVHLLPGLAVLALLLVSNAPSMSIDSRLDLRFAAFSSAWVFCVLSLFAWQPHRPRIDSSRFYILLATFGTLVPLLPLFAPRLALLLTLPSGAWLVIHLWRRVPQTMCLADDHLGSDSRTSARRERAGSLNRWVARRTFGRPWFLGLAVGLFYLAMSAQWNLGGILVQTVPLTVWFTAWMLRISAGTLRDLAHLPIPRRALAAWILLPPAIILLAGTIAGNAVGGSWSTWEFRRQVNLSFDQPDEESRSTRENWHVQVPGELLRFHWGNKPLSIEAPGGETATIEPISLLWYFPLRLVNPYDVDLENSAEFIAWQLSRAVQDAYGITVSPEALQAKYMTGKGFSPTHFGWDYPNAKAGSYPGGKLAVGLCLSAVLWALALLFFTAERLPARDPARWKWRIAARATLGALVVGALGTVPTFGMTHGQIHAMLRRTMDGSMNVWMTSHPWLSAASSLAALAAIYGLGMRQIERMEIPIPHPVLEAERRRLT